MRLGLIGHGAIGAGVVAAAKAGELGPAVELVAVLVRRERPSTDGPPGERPVVTSDPERFFALRPEVVVEVAGHQAVHDHGARTLESGADLVLTSIGALVSDAQRARLYAVAETAGRRLVLASAGIGALDILTAAAVGGLERVTMTVRKDPPSWLGTAAEELCDLAALKEPLVIYQGPVRGGAARYPQNVNIAAAVGLAGLGLDRTELIIVADPTIHSHVITIEAAGSFGSFSFTEDITPSPDNPKTGLLVAPAVIKTIRQLASPVVIGG